MTFVAKRTCLFAVCLFAVLLPLVPAAVGQQPEEIEFSVGLERSGLSLHEPIFIVVSVRNRLPVEVQFDLGPNRAHGFVPAVTSPDPNAVSLRPAVPPSPDGNFGPFSRVVLRPGDTYQQRLLLNERFRFSSPGDFAVTVQVGTEFQTPDGGLAMYNAPGSVNFNIGPRSEDRLRERCAELASMASSGASNAEAALALSYIEDAIALPFLRQVLLAPGGRQIEQYAAAGLARLGSEEAIEILIARLSVQDEITRYALVSALRAAAASVSDQKLKDRIATALGP